MTCFAIMSHFCRTVGVCSNCSYMLLKTFDKTYSDIGNLQL